MISADNKILCPTCHGARHTSSMCMTCNGWGTIPKSNPATSPALDQAKPEIEHLARFTYEANTTSYAKMIPYEIRPDWDGLPDEFKQHWHNVAKAIYDEVLKNLNNRMRKKIDETADTGRSVADEALRRIARG
jgi:acyl-CoA reductase-like NAD-dependent aldehyde dehydrogenase